MDNLIEDNELEISQNDNVIEKPKRKMSDKTRQALAVGRANRAEKLNAQKSNQKSIPEPILKKKAVKEVELPPVETPVPKQRKKKQVIIYESESDDDEQPTIIIKRKSSKKADIPPPIPKVIEPEIEEKPLYRMRRI
jgi:hypothetical protein